MFHGLYRVYPKETETTTSNNPRGYLVKIRVGLASAGNQLGCSEKVTEIFVSPEVYEVGRICEVFTLVEELENST